MGWDIVDPGYLGVMLVWWPVDVFGRLMALGCLLGMGTGVLLDRPFAAGARAAVSALAAEVLVGIKVCVPALAGLVPAIAVLSFGVPQTVPGRIGLLLLAALGLLPALHYFLSRALAPIHILRSGLSATGALEASARQTRGRFTLFLRLALPWTLGAWALDGLALAVPDPWALLLGPLSLAASLLAFRRADQGLA
jgi:hypothetical protein